MHQTSNKLVKSVSIIIGAIIALVGLIMMFRVLQNTLTNASDKSPREVSISEISTSQAKITWVSDQEYIGSIDVGTAIDRLDSHYQEIATEKRSKHAVLVTLLSSETTYYFQIADDTGAVYKNAAAPGQDGLPWSFTTKVKETETETSVGVPTITPRRKFSTPTPSIAGCSYTDCDTVHDHLGTDCSIIDYRKCVLKK